MADLVDSSGLAAGSGPRTQSFVQSISSGNFIVNSNSAAMSTMLFIVGFYGRYDNQTFSLSASMSILNSTDYQITFKTDGSNIYYNASTYMVACLNNLTTYAEVGSIYGRYNQQLNTIYTIDVSDNGFYGLTDFKFEGVYDVYIRMGAGYKMTNSTAYQNLTFRYIDFR